MHQNQLNSQELKVTFLDLETTSKNPNTCEILTAYLRTRRVYDFKIIDECYLTFRPELYLEDSYKIHKIGYAESNKFSDKWDSLRILLKYLNGHRDSIFCCHANHLVFGAYGYFDEQVIRQVCSSQSSRTYFWYLHKQLKWISTHTIAKRFLTLENYKLDTLSEYFNFDFKHHNCKSDVDACENIFLNLIDKNITKDELFNIGNYNGNYRRNGKQSAGEFSL